ncbi:MAG: TraB/GumN family protein [Sphingomicrobium sp.]
MRFFTTLTASIAFVSTASAAQAPVPPDDGALITVTARRTGIPVWRVQSGASTIVLVGSIPDIPEGTRWNAQALDAAIGQSRRVLFPQTVGLTANRIGLVWWMVRWGKQSQLPAGQTLSSMLDPVDLARLGRLAGKKLVARDWDNIHPLHLALKMQSDLRESTAMGPTLDEAVEESIKKHKVYRVPFAQTDAGPVMRRLFASRPQDHVACLKATLAVIDAGPDELRRRSKAWADRDVIAATASPVQAIEAACWPANAGKAVDPNLFAEVTRTLKRKGATLAVINLDTLARRGGLLDKLQAAGTTIDGPAWK